MLNVYTPTEGGVKEEENGIYEEIEEEFDRMPKEYTILILRDFNAQIGKEEHLEQVAGEYTVHEKTIDNGQRLNLNIRGTIE